MEDSGEDTADFEISEAGLRILKEPETSQQKRNHGILAVMLAKQAKRFQEHATRVVGGSKVAPARGDDMRQLLEWKQSMEQDILNQEQQFPPPLEAPIDAGVTALAAPPGGSVEHIASDIEGALVEQALPDLSIEELNEEQRRAYNVVLWHLQQTQAGVVDLPPLRMMI